jgi:OMF family outer membrane factor
MPKLRHVFPALILRRFHPLIARLTVVSALVAPMGAGFAAPASKPSAAPGPAAGPGPASVAAPTTTSAQISPELQINRPLPLAPAQRGNRPKARPDVLAPAATKLPEGLKDLIAPSSLALPDQPGQVRIRQLRPLTYDQVQILAEVNNPELKAIASEVDQAQSELRAQIALWYPQIDLNISQFPAYTRTERSTIRAAGSNGTLTSIWAMDASLEASWALINPARTPRIAVARDRFERDKNQYLIGLRDLRLQAAQAYFELQTADDQVQIGQEGVRSSLVSLRDARARFQAGVATKLEVLEAETQLARDEQLLTNALALQAIARRALAALLDLPQEVTPTAADPARVVGTWMPSLQQSILAAFAFREELDQVLLDISIANSTANASLANVQPLLRIFNSFGVGRSYGYLETGIQDPARPSNSSWSADNAFGLNLSWKLYDGGEARATYRRNKQVADENRYRFADKRDQIRLEVEESFYELEKNNRNILTTSREVISAREALRLARLRFQAGVTTQREVVDNQRDLTQAEVRYSNAISEYNKRLIQLSRRTGLDKIATCPPATLPPNKPQVSGATDVPVEPLPLLPACPSRSVPSTMAAPGS